MRRSGRSVSIVAWLTTAIGIVSTVPAYGADSLISNGDFASWTDGLPDDWTLEIGAMNGAKEPKSEVKQIQGPALMLRGDASTMAWHSVSQAIPAKEGKHYQLEFQSRVKGIKREGRQYNNCYVGILSFDADDKPIDVKIEDLASDLNWTNHVITATVPSDAEATKVVIFLSKTGILGIKNLTVTEHSR